METKITSSSATNVNKRVQFGTIRVQPENQYLWLTNGPDSVILNRRSRVPSRIGVIMVRRIYQGHFFFSYRLKSKKINIFWTFDFLGVESGATVCCPGKQDPCILPRVDGDGKYAQLRWYFDIETKSCHQFTFRGNKGNANNFITREECESKCPVYIDPCPTTYTFSGTENIVSSVYLPCNNESKTCPDSYWCHLGATQETTVCCPNGKLKFLMIVLH